jgi:hypothetical protein
MRQPENQFILHDGEIDHRQRVGNHCVSWRTNVEYTELLGKCGAWGSVVVKACATSRKVLGRVTGEFFWGIWQVHVPGVDSAFRNEYQELLGETSPLCYDKIWYDIDQQSKHNYCLLIQSDVQ